MRDWKKVSKRKNDEMYGSIKMIERNSEEFEKGKKRQEKVMW